MPKLIKVDDLLDGMELALPVKNKLGQVLLGKGSKLEEKYKKIFRTWGIEHVSVKGDDDADILYSDKQLADAKIKLVERFTWIPRNSFETELFEIALQNILETELTHAKGIQ